MSRSGRDDASLPPYEMDKEEYLLIRKQIMDQNLAKKRSLNLLPSFEACGLKKSKPTAQPRNRVPKVCYYSTTTQ